MPKLRDLYGVDLNRLGGYRPEYTSVMERPLTDFEREQRSAPIDRPYASGQLEAPMIAPDDLIGSGIPTKLAALAKGSIPAIAGIFIGPNHPSWSKEAAELALQMKANGVDPRSIHKTTGTLTELPGYPAVQEISDKGASWRPNVQQNGGDGGIGPARIFMSHPQLFDGYPNLARVSTALSLSSDKPEGYFIRSDRHMGVAGRTPDEARSVMLHELQHGVQAEESWPGGTSFFKARSFLPANATNDEVQHRYLTNAGEVMARITEARRDMDDLQRRRHYPLDGISLKDLWSE